MTVIAWDGKTLAADKLANLAGLPATTTKIRRAENGALMAGSGDQDVALALMAWYDDGADRAKYPDNRDGPNCRAYLMVITPNGKVERYEREPFALRYEDKITAMGSGRDFAIAAMHLGCTAAEAVTVACLFDVNCGNGIDMLELRP